jgi:hypothetical protein
MPKPKTTQTMAFNLSVKVPIDMQPRETAALIREAVGDLRSVIQVRVTPIREAK